MQAKSAIPWDGIQVIGGGLQDDPAKWFDQVLGVRPKPVQLAFIRALLNRRAALDAAPDTRN